MHPTLAEANKCQDPHFLRKNYLKSDVVLQVLLTGYSRQLSSDIFFHQLDIHTSGTIILYQAADMSRRKTTASVGIPLETDAGSGTE